MQARFKPLFAIVALTLCSLTERAQAVVQGIDVSRFQSTLSWPTAKSQGIDFAFVKATEGVDFVDVSFINHMNNAIAAGVLVGPYHFARPDSFKTDPLDAANEANDFVDAIQPFYQSSNPVLRPVIDLERTSGQPTLAAEREFLSRWIRNFAAVVESRLGLKPIIYTGGSFTTQLLEPDISQFPLWMYYQTGANDFAAAFPPSTSALGIWGGQGYTFWQWSGTGSVAGISPIDRDVFAGTLQDLQMFTNAVPEPSSLFLAALVAVVGVISRGIPRQRRAS